MDPGPGAPAAPDMGRNRLRFSNRSVALAVAIIAGAPFLLRLVGSAGRVLGWLAVASILAALLHPLVTLLARRIPRGLAIPLVLLLTVGTVAGLVWSGYDDLITQARRLEEAAPDAAGRIEDRDDGFGEAAREFELERRISEFVEQVPERLRGGDTASALRSAATRGVAYFATGILTIFLLLHGPRLGRAGLAQVHDLDRRARLSALGRAAYGRAWRYLVLTLARAAMAGGFGLLAADLADVPGNTVLALWVAAWSLVPLMGVIVGSIPLLLLTAALNSDRLLLIALLVVAYQTAEVLLVQRRLERMSLHVGPIVTLVAVIAGLEAYGIGGSIVILVAAIGAVAVLKELAPRESDELLVAADAVLPGDEA